jgi:hypothetical protein
MIVSLLVMTIPYLTIDYASQKCVGYKFPEACCSLQLERDVCTLNEEGPTLQRDKSPRLQIERSTPNQNHNTYIAYGVVSVLTGLSFFLVFLFLFLFMSTFFLVDHFTCPIELSQQQTIKLSTERYSVMNFPMPNADIYLTGFF